MHLRVPGVPKIPFFQSRSPDERFRNHNDEALIKQGHRGQFTMKRFQGVGPVQHSGASITIGIKSNVLGGLSG
jgi:hypothetical protein